MPVAPGGFMAYAEAAWSSRALPPCTVLVMSESDLALTPQPPRQVEIVVPVRNEERDLRPCIRRLCAFLRTAFPFRAGITIADNGSTDRTWQAARALCAEFAEVRAVRIVRPGRGGALRSVWLRSSAQVLAYMDVDLSTDLNALLPLVAPLLSGHSDLAIGTRLARGARVVRGPRRELISRAYNLLRVNPVRCSGHGSCAELLPELITMDEWGYPIASRQPVPAHLIRYARRAVAQCPALALLLTQAAVPTGVAGPEAER